MICCPCWVLVKTGNDQMTAGFKSNNSIKVAECTILFVRFSFMWSIYKNDQEPDDKFENQRKIDMSELNVR